MCPLQKSDNEEDLPVDYNTDTNDDDNDNRYI